MHEFCLLIVLVFESLNVDLAVCDDSFQLVLLFLQLEINAIIIGDGLRHVVSRLQFLCCLEQLLRLCLEFRFFLFEGVVRSDGGLLQLLHFYNEFLLFLDRFIEFELEMLLRVFDL